MADVFVSYKKSDRERVRPLVEHLRAGGLEVWWDEGIAPSMSWRGEIAKQLNDAKCVIAVWTHGSVDHEQGQWVMEEASHGLARRILAPVRLDLVAPPLGFGEVQYADLAAWDGTDADPRFVHFRDVVRAIVNAEPVAVGPTPTNFAAPGVSLQNVSMKNVTIQVSKTMPNVRDDDAEDDEPVAASAPPPRPRSNISLSMIVTRAIGVIFPLIGLMIFIFSMGGMACSQGNAPAFFCQALDALRPH